MRKIYIAIAAAFLAAQAFAEDGLTDLSVLPRFWGLSAGISYKAALAEGLDSEFRVELGGAWEALNYFRDPSGDIIAAPGATELARAAFTDWNFDWALGAEQGILWNAATGRNLLEAFLYYRGRSDLREDAGTGQYVFASGRPDAPWGRFHSLLAGFDLADKRDGGTSGTFSGYAAELSLEWGPSFMSGSGTDFLRLNLNAAYFLPLMEETAGGMNLASLYLAAFIDLDYSTGSSVPIYVSGTLGGRKPRYGLGDAVRGIDLARYDAPFKALANLELRFNGPSFLDPSLFPIATAFVDLGYYASLDGALPAAGFKASAGFSLMLNLLDLAEAGIGIVYCFGDTMGGQAFSVFLAFGHKFLGKARAG